MAVKKKIEKILSKTDIDERLEKWVNERRNNLAVA